MNKLVIAHRGASSLAHENTLEAFEKAVELGSDMVEFDVRRTRDGTLVVHHDECIGNSFLSDMSLGESKSAALRNGFDLPTLEETLLLLKNRISLDIELKEQGYEVDVAKAVLGHFDPAAVCITSFYDASLAQVHRAYPQLRTGMLLGASDPRKPLSTRLSEFFPERRCRQAQADFLAPHYKLLRFGFLRRAERLRKQLIVWTVDDRKLMSSLLRQPAVIGIITNRPDVALEMRAAILG